MDTMIKYDMLAYLHSVRVMTHDFFVRRIGAFKNKYYVNYPKVKLIR